MTPNEINAFLQLAKITKQQLAEELGYTHDEISRTISGDRVNQPIREAIAKKFGIAVEQFFGKDHMLAASARKEEAA